jgi:hypothetical protein
MVVKNTAAYTWDWYSHLMGDRASLEHLSDASFLGKLLVLPANDRLVWKVIPRYKHSSLFGLIISNKGKKFNNIDTWWKYDETFFQLLVMVRTCKLECSLVPGRSGAPIYGRLLGFFTINRQGTHVVKLFTFVIYECLW